MSRGTVDEVRTEVQLPEPGRFWIRYVPRAWEVPDRPWVDLAQGALGAWERAPRGRTGDLAAWAEARADDLFYLPPVPAKRSATRDRVAQSLLVSGTPVLVQLFPDEATTVPGVKGVAFVYDLLACLLDRDLGALRRLPAGSCAVWPLIAGLSDDPSLWEVGCGDLAAAGVRQVQAMTLTLSAGDRRRLAERRGDAEEAFDALFHAPEPSERSFAQAAARHGLEPFLPRPLPRPPLLGEGNRRLAGLVASIADLWLRLGRPGETGHALYRSARWIDGSAYDVEGLAREGNLGVLPLEEIARSAVAEWVEEGESSLLRELQDEYLSSGPPTTPDSAPADPRAGRGSPPWPPSYPGRPQGGAPTETFAGPDSDPSSPEDRLRGDAK